MSKALPPELLSEIIRYFGDDQVSLKEFSLVNKSWLEATRQQLFRRFSFPPATINAFSAHENHGLTLSKSKTSPLRFVRDFIFNGEQLPMDDKLAVLLQVSSLQFFSALTHLWLSYVEFPNPQHVVETACACTQLHALSLEHIRFLNPNPQNTAKTNPTAPNTLRRLRFRHTHPAPLLLTLFPPGIPSDAGINVTHISMSPITQSDVVAFRDLDRVVGRFQHMAVAYAFQTNQEQGHWCQDSSTLRELSQLRSWYIGHFITVPSTSGLCINPSPRIVPGLLGTICAPLLERVVLELAINRVGQVDEEGPDINWASLDNVLAGGQSFPTLREVCFHVTGRANIEGLESLLMCRLPLCHNRGLLNLSPKCESPL